MLQAEGLACERARRRLFSGLDLSLSSGELLHISGPNGSGKTTLLRILMGFYTEFDGEVLWNLERPALFLGHNPGISPRLTVAENIRWLCHLQETEVQQNRLDEVVEVIGLAGYQETACDRLSEGQKKRVGLARFFLCENSCWIMDEPFSAIDSDGLGFLQQQMEQHLKQQGSILMTSHQTLTLDASIRQLELGP